MYAFVFVCLVHTAFYVCGSIFFTLFEKFSAIFHCFIPILCILSFVILNQHILSLLILPSISLTSLPYISISLLFVLYCMKLLQFDFPVHEFVNYKWLYPLNFLWFNFLSIFFISLLFSDCSMILIAHCCWLFLYSILIFF